MPTPSKGPRMGGSPAHERLMLANLATSLFEHGRITTTESKAKRLRPYAEHLVTFAKRGDLHARRQVLKRLNDKSVVHTLFAEIGPRYATRPGGYTRIVKLGPRKGDNAPMALIELVEALTVAQQAVGEADEALAGESETAAAVAAAAAPVDDAPIAGSEVVTTSEAAVDEAAGAEPSAAESAATEPPVPDVVEAAVSPEPDSPATTESGAGDAAAAPRPEDAE